MSFRLPKSNRGAPRGATALGQTDSRSIDRAQSHFQQQLPEYIRGSNDPLTPVVRGRRSQTETETDTDAHHSYGGGGLQGIEFAHSEYSDEPSVSSSRTNSVMRGTAAAPSSLSSTTARQSFVIKHLCHSSTGGQGSGGHITIIRGHSGDRTDSGVPLDSMNTVNNNNNLHSPQSDVMVSMNTPPRVTGFRIRRLGGGGVGGEKWAEGGKQQPLGLGPETRAEGPNEVVRTATGNAADKGAESAIGTREKGLTPLDLIVLDSRRQNQRNDAPQPEKGGTRKVKEAEDGGGEGSTTRKSRGPFSIIQTRSPTPTVPHHETHFTARHEDHNKRIGDTVMGWTREEIMNAPSAAPSSHSAVHQRLLVDVQSDPQEGGDQAKVKREKYKDAVVEEGKASKVQVQKAADDPSTSIFRGVRVIGRVLSAHDIGDPHHQQPEKEGKQSENEKETETKEEEGVVTVRAIERLDSIRGAAAPADAAASGGGLFVVDLVAMPHGIVTSLSCTPSCENSFRRPVPLSRRSSTFLDIQQTLGLADTSVGDDNHESGSNMHIGIAGGNTQETVFGGNQKDNSSPLATFTFSSAAVKAKGAVAQSNANPSLKEYEENSPDSPQGSSSIEEETGKASAVSTPGPLQPRRIMSESLSTRNSTEGRGDYGTEVNGASTHRYCPKSLPAGRADIDVSSEEWASLAEASKKFYASRGGASRVRLEWGRAAEEARYLADEPPEQVMPMPRDVISPRVMNKRYGEADSEKNGMMLARSSKNNPGAEKQHEAMMHELKQEKSNAQSPSKVLLFSPPPLQHDTHDLAGLQVRRQHSLSAKKALPSPSSALTPRAIDSSFLLRSTAPRDSTFSTTGPPSLPRRQRHTDTKHNEDKPATTFAAFTVRKPLSTTPTTNTRTSAAPETSELNSRAYDDAMRGRGSYEGRVSDGLFHSPHFMKSVRKRLNQVDHTSPRNRTSSDVRISEDATAKSTPRHDYGRHVRSAGSDSVTSTSTSTSTALIDVYSPIISRGVTRARGVGVGLGWPAVRDGPEPQEQSDSILRGEKEKSTMRLLEDKGHLFAADRKQTAAAVTIQRYVRGWLTRGWLWLWLHANARAAEDAVSERKVHIRRTSCFIDTSGKNNTHDTLSASGKYTYRAIMSACIGSSADSQGFWTRDEELMKKIRYEDRKAARRDREAAKYHAASAHRKALLDAHQSKEDRPRETEERYAETAAILRRAREGASAELKQRAIADLAERRSPAGKEAARSPWLDTHRRNTAARWSREGWHPVDGLYLEEGKGGLETELSV